MKSPLRVLIVEDSEDDAMLLRMRLEAGGYDLAPARVDTATDLKAALAGRQWDLILSDYCLPGFDGLEALRLVREHGGDVPLILVSGAVGEELAVAAMRAGAHDFLLKDNLSRLVPAVERELGEAESRSLFRRAQEALRESERNYRIVADNAHAWEFWLDPEGRFLYSSPSCRRVTGYDAEAFLADPKLIEGIVYPEDRAIYREHTNGVGGECATREVEFRINHRDGSVRWISHACQAVHDEDGRFLGVRGSNRDVTDHKRIAEALQQSEARLQTTIENLSEGVIITDIEGNLLHWNRAALAMHGLVSPGESRRPLSELETILHLSTIDGTELPLKDWPMSRILRGETLHDQEFRLKNIEVGLDRIFSYSGSLVHTGDERPGLGVLSMIDVTERRQAEEELAEAKRSAEEANRAKDRFLAVLSHELRTPLTPVVASLATLQERRDLDGPTHEVLEMIRRNVELEARLIDDLLDVNRIVRGKLELDRRTVPLCEIITRAAEVCRPDIEARGLHFGVDLGPSVPYFVDGDAVRLQQAFWNLLKNAIKFTPEGGCVGVRCRKDNQAVLAEVVDSGDGIDTDLLPHLFEAFEQGTARNVHQFGGLGLGLTIAKGLVEMHGGSISAHSEGRGKGSTFRIRLPLASARPIREPPPAAPAPLRPLRMLLVEDHGDTASALQWLLRARGHQVESAGALATAKRALDRGRFDILLSDLALPDGSGHDLMRWLVAQGRLMPAIAVSGYGQESDIAESRSAGFAAHLTKPVLIDQLMRAIAAAVGN